MSILIKLKDYTKICFVTNRKEWILMKKKKTHAKHYVTLTIALALTVALTGCSSAENPEPKEEANASTEKVAETKVEEKAETAEAENKNEEAIPEAAESASEPTAEPTPEPVVYEGIDMESTLPGEEWIKTFEGVVDEPVAIIYNDNTGRKEIIQEGSIVKLNPDEDRFAVYSLERTMNSDINIPVSEINGFSNYETIVPNVEGVRSASEWDAKLTVIGGEEDWVRNFTILVE